MTKTDKDKLQRARTLCLDQAASFISAAEHLAGRGEWSHLVYHLSLLALEETGKANMLCTRMINHETLDGSWIDRSFADHRRKLQWAVWSPGLRITPADFEAARKFAEQSHAMRLASIYVDPEADLTDPPPRDKVAPADAEATLSLARARLEYERARGTPTGELDGLTEWFLDTMADTERSRLLLSAPFVAKYEELNADAKAWALWAREEIERSEREHHALIGEELKRPAAGKGAARPRWRANLTVYTPSHSIRAKTLSRWNERIDAVQLVWAGKKDRFTLQITLGDNLPLPALYGRLSSLAKIVLSCLSIATIGYFWLEPPGFQKEMFKGIRDLERGLAINIEAGESFWGTGRVVALTDEMIDRAATCMMAFMPLPEHDAEPIFSHYFHGLALIAKSDVYYNLDEPARQEFTFSLFEALRRHAGWNGTPDELDLRLHDAFAEIVPEREHRELLFKSLTVRGDPDESSLANLRTAKQVADLYGCVPVGGVARR